ncbi:right-handed parallel beta-helix repeat-containing protein [Streptomyces sp. NPDC059590]|uniref:right-handed parallel beta-helix repeat-containing protein n=1 Tax=Streptomyces sp. NPDC059590 TaxID=3346877 RepID=UPI00369584DA
MRKSGVPALILALLAGGGAMAAAPAGAAAPEEITVYVDPDVPAGEARARSGRTAGDAVASFEEAERILRSKGAINARILTPGGTYYPEKEINWSYDPPGGDLTFAAVPGTGKVVFDGSRGNRAAAASGYYMTITSANSNITVSGRTIQRYTNGGIRIRGGSGDRVNNVTIKGNTFRYLGNKHSSGGIGYGGVHITSSSKVKITGNKFYYLENRSSPGAIHGVYLANATNSSVISGNRFGYVSGDPIRTRNNSKNNTVSGNKFWRAGTYAIFSDWRFGREACGRGNVFKNNVVGRTSYYGKKFGSAKQGKVKPIKILMWGHDAPTNANLGGCTPAPVKSGGGNRYVTSRPW